MPSSTTRRLPKTPRRTIRSAAWAVTLLLVAAAVLGAMSMVTKALSPVTADRNAPAVLVTVPRGANARQIGGLLARRHLVRYAAGFALAARLEGVGDKMRAGRYELSPAMPPRQIAELIALGRTANDFVTVPEGYTVAQIARRLAERSMADENQFLTLARTRGRTFHVAGWTPPGDDLEGYLFPDTYRVPRGTTPRQIIEQMLGDFRRRVLVPFQSDFARYPGGLPAAVTMASLVEREAETDADRPLIASALTNRLRQGMRLQCDATVQYALPEHKGRLLYSDLRVDSPYNTYQHAGLPPTPIASPGLPSIEAALHPARSDYLYYVARPDGSHVFSRTLAEHDRARAELRAGGT
ncbi:MAG: endolytic transglycosylase MltG [Armatimonadetes bacterium]|nr:endolytic transglycosylase MltG [Armatimonadota bacterium]